MQNLAGENQRLQRLTKVDVHVLLLVKFLQINYGANSLSVISGWLTIPQQD